tara:strand:- start:367 stop:594 length:228 start_codon:yes stop_codon:yes gene_type:complete
MDLANFIYDNIKKELIAMGHSPTIAASCAAAAKAKYMKGSNWKMGAVYGELSKEAKKVAGKVKIDKTKKTKKVKS